jgi:hypothetical protein
MVSTFLTWSPADHSPFHISHGYTCVSFPSQLLSRHRCAHCHSQSAELAVNVQRCQSQYSVSTTLHSPECWPRTRTHHLRASLVNWPISRNLYLVCCHRQRRAWVLCSDQSKIALMPPAVMLAINIGTSSWPCFSASSPYDPYLL